MPDVLDVTTEDGIRVITAPSMEEALKLGSVDEGTQGFIGGQLHTYKEGKWVPNNEDEQVPDWMRTWFEEGRKLGVVKEERSKEELEQLKECAIGASLIHNYCRNKELPEAIIDMIICEAAMRWYEADHPGEVVDDPLKCKALPAYHEHVAKFIHDFSEHLQHVRATYTSNVASGEDGLNFNLKGEE